MAAKVKLDPERLEQLLAQFKEIQQDCDEQQTYIKRVRAALDWDVPEKKVIDEKLADLQKRLSKQNEKLNVMISATHLAILEAANSEDSLKNRILNMILKFLNAALMVPVIGALTASAFVPIIVSVLHSLFGLDVPHGITSVKALRDWIQSLIEHGDDNSTGDKPEPDKDSTQTTVQPSPSEDSGNGVAMDADTEVSERAKRMKNMLDTKEGSPDYVNVGCDKYNDEPEYGKSVNCVWLARQKICDILGDKTLFSDPNKLGSRIDNWKKYEATGINGYSVDYVESNGKQIRDVIDNIKQSQPATVVFYCNGHTFTVDRIEDGQIYFTDQRRGQANLFVDDATIHSSNVWAAKSGQPIAISIDDFSKSSYGSNILQSYVILKKQA